MSEQARKDQAKKNKELQTLLRNIAITTTKLKLLER